MITRRHILIGTALRYSWKNVLFGIICGLAAYLLQFFLGHNPVKIPVAVVAIQGTALAIILGFRNTSAYDRWWEARKIWGGIVNESRTFMRQVLTIVDPASVSAELRENSERIVRGQIAWVNALRLQLRNQKDSTQWKNDVAVHLRNGDYDLIMSKSNKVTQLGILQGYAIKELHAHETMDIFSYIQMDDTLTRITDLQGRAERIKSTPLPRPYDYYTLLFLNIFILFFPFAFLESFVEQSLAWLVVPVTVIIGWTFYQIYVFGLVLSNPFENWQTDVALTAICNLIEIDLKETIGDKNIPEKMEPSNGALM